MRQFTRFALAAFASCVLLACGGGDQGPGSGSGTPPAPPPTGLSYPGLPTLTVGTPMSPVLPTVSGAVTSFVVSPSLPAGLALNPGSGEISGTPTAAVPATSHTVRAINSAGEATFALTITVLAADEFRLEPASGTTIGIGQQIDLFGAYKARRTDPYPQYVDPQQIAFSSSQPGVAVVTSGGGVRGVSAGTTTITATYRSISSQVQITVAGNYEQRTVNVPGQGARGYSVYVPAAASGPRPLLLAIHGGGGTARINASMTLLARLGAQQGILIAFPEGTGVIQTFNAGSCCGGAQTQNIDDVAFLSALIDDVRANFSVDPARVYSTGFSNGGMMSWRLACAMADRIAGIAAVGGASGERDLDGNSYYACAPSRPIRVLHLHATNDRNYPYVGGVGEGLSNTNFFPVDSTISLWRTRNNVSASARIEASTQTTTCTHYETPLDAARPSAPVSLCRSDPPDVYDPVSGIVFGGGHSWPGGSRSPSPGGDAPLQDFDASNYLWGLLNR